MMKSQIFIFLIKLIETYDDLMQKVIIPIYPDETERKYNAHIKSRALAGYYEDKKWYGYSGSRNSGKETETGILRNAFGDFVLEFNAKCLIFNKFGNPEPAKALSWVVNKKDARIIISNEIDGDEETNEMEHSLNPLHLVLSKIENYMRNK
jgi:hypothetical protein